MPSFVLCSGWLVEVTRLGFRHADVPVCFSLYVCVCMWVCYVHLSDIMAVLIPGKWGASIGIIEKVVQLLSKGLLLVLQD